MGGTNDPTVRGSPQVTPDHSSSSLLVDPSYTIATHSIFTTTTPTSTPLYTSSSTVGGTNDPTVRGSPLQAWVYIVVAIAAVFGVIIIVLITILCVVLCLVRNKTNRCELGMGKFSYITIVIVQGVLTMLGSYNYYSACCGALFLSNHAWCTIVDSNLDHACWSSLVPVIQKLRI